MIAPTAVRWVFCNRMCFTSRICRMGRKVGTDCSGRAIDHAALCPRCDLQYDFGRAIIGSSAHLVSFHTIYQRRGWIVPASAIGRAALRQWRDSRYHFRLAIDDRPYGGKMGLLQSDVLHVAYLPHGTQSGDGLFRPRD